MSEQIEQRAQQIVEQVGNDAYTVALHFAAHESELRNLKKQLYDEIDAVKRHANKIKADAVRDWANQANPNNESEDRVVNDAYDCADKLERGEA